MAPMAAAAAAAVVVAPPSSSFHRPLVPSESPVHFRPSPLRVPAPSRGRGVRLVLTRVEFSSEIEQQFSGDDVCSSSTGSAHWFNFSGEPFSGSNASHGRMRRVFRCNCTSHENQDTASNEDSTKGAEEDSPSGGVAIAIKVLQFYKREISPLLPGSCRFVPTCSEYGMQAFKKYGVVKGTILTAWRLSRCNPLGGSGFDPPRWFDEPRPPPY